MVKTRVQKPGGVFAGDAKRGIEAHRAISIQCRKPIEVEETIHRSLIPTLSSIGTFVTTSRCAPRNSSGYDLRTLIWPVSRSAPEGHSFTLVGRNLAKRIDTDGLVLRYLKPFTP